ncbi:MAG: hypothetical protein WC716_14550 [Chitinophagaceae bacterium]|jgi:hypothetical protein
MSEFKLVSEIILRSNANDWQQAKGEWKLQSISFAKPPHVCLCGHYPIIELCLIQNKQNGNRATVGNCCVKKFMGLRTNKFFEAIKRINADSNRSVNLVTLEIAYKENWISYNDYSFYRRILKTSKLSVKQKNWKIGINNKIIFRSGI